MIEQLAMATGMILLTVVIHAFGLWLLRRLIGLELANWGEDRPTQISLRRLVVTLTVVLGVFALHGLEIWLYAGLYLLLEAIPDLHTAVYVSTIAYSTVGFDDEGIERSWQLIAAIESINGVNLLGWSTAFFVFVGSRLTRG